MRKKRSDRNHAIYCIENTITGESYIGITGCSRAIVRSVKVRVQKHMSRARTEVRDWNLYENIRRYGEENFVYWVMETVRGKAEAHRVEREYIREYNPVLNTF